MTRQLIALVTAWLLFVSQATSGIFWFQPALSAGGGGGCTVQKDQVAGAESDINALAADSGTTYVGGQFTAGSSYTLCAVTLRLRKVGTPTFTLNAKIYTNNAGSPGTLVGTGSNNFSISSLTTSDGDAAFTGLSASLTSGTVYWIVIQSTGSPNDFSDYGIVSGAFGSTTFRQSANGTTWSNGAGSIAIRFTSYSQ